MRTWEYVRELAGESCGYCNKRQKVNTPVLVIDIPAMGNVPKRRRIRCTECAEEPIDLDQLEQCPKVEVPGAEPQAPAVEIPANLPFQADNKPLSEINDSLNPKSGLPESEDPLFAEPFEDAMPMPFDAKMAAAGRDD